jgi:hypothetical protein
VIGTGCAVAWPLRSAGVRIVFATSSSNLQHDN